jgi:hypothetical protein
VHDYCSIPATTYNLRVITRLLFHTNHNLQFSRYYLSNVPDLVTVYIFLNTRLVSDPAAIYRLRYYPTIVPYQPLFTIFALLPDYCSISATIYNFRVMIGLLFRTSHLQFSGYNPTIVPYQPLFTIFGFLSDCCFILATIYNFRVVTRLLFHTSHYLQFSGYYPTTVSFPSSQLKADSVCSSIQIIF